MKTPEHYSIGWFWDGFEHVDPAKEASAQEKRLANKTTSLATEYARTGRDWEEELRQIARERELMTELGLEPTQDVLQDKTPQPPSQNTEESDEQ